MNTRSGMTLRSHKRKLTFGDPGDDDDQNDQTGYDESDGNGQLYCGTGDDYLSQESGTTLNVITKLHMRSAEWDQMIRNEELTLSKLDQETNQKMGGLRHMNKRLDDLKRFYQKEVAGLNLTKAKLDVVRLKRSQLEDEDDNLCESDNDDQKDDPIEYDQISIQIKQAQVEMKGIKERMSQMVGENMTQVSRSHAIKWKLMRQAEKALSKMPEAINDGITCPEVFKERKRQLDDDIKKSKGEIRKLISIQNAALNNKAGGDGANGTQTISSDSSEGNIEIIDPKEPGTSKYFKNPGKTGPHGLFDGLTQDAHNLHVISHRS